MSGEDLPESARYDLWQELERRGAVYGRIIFGVEDGQAVVGAIILYDRYAPPYHREMADVDLDSDLGRAMWLAAGGRDIEQGDVVSGDGEMGFIVAERAVNTAWNDLSPPVRRRDVDRVGERRQPPQRAIRQQRQSRGPQPTMIELMTVVAPNGSLLHLGAMPDEQHRPPDTNVPKDVPLAFWHDDSPLFDEENPVPIMGRISSIWPVLIAGGSYFVVAGEVENENVDGVLLRFSKPEQPPFAEEMASVTNVLGRRVWMSHPHKMPRKWVVSAKWLPSGTEESVLVDPVSER